jgi:hypothetical protein
LIGVTTRPDQAGVVEEFFQLFKTPWEFCRPGRRYDVILSTVDEIPEMDAPLILAYGSSEKDIDAWIGIASIQRRRGAIVEEKETSLPVYGDLLTFGSNSKEVCCRTENSEAAAVKCSWHGRTLIRVGYDLFDEINHLLSAGQPVEQAATPTLDIHIRMLREWILDEGIELVEIPPTPAGHDFTVCLTHDIDFVGIRNHKFDHTMWGFLYRATAGAFQRLLRGKISLDRCIRSWRAAASLPFVYLGWVEDFWEPFEWYLKTEKGLEASYFLIPFKGRPGENLSGAYTARRAAAYDVERLSDSILKIQSAGCEVGIHGIDSWHSVEKGEAELAKIATITGHSDLGIRMHWLLQDANTDSVLEQCGYVYDATAGYNETIGYRNGTSQVFRPLKCKTMLEVPLHVQDGALFYPNRLDLPEPEAERRCWQMVNNAQQFGGVLTFIWHDRSHGPERFWGDFYAHFLERLKTANPWFATTGHAVNWTQKRRNVCFDSPLNAPGKVKVRVNYEGNEIQPPLRIRVHVPGKPSKLNSADRPERAFVDVPWNGISCDEITQLLAQMNDVSADVTPGSASTDPDGSSQKGVPACTR